MHHQAMNFLGKLLLTAILLLPSPAQSQVGWASDGETLYSVDLATAVAQPLGPLSPNIGAMARSTTGEFFAVEEEAEELYRLNPRTLALDLIGSTGIRTSVQGLSSDDEGALWMISRDTLYEIDPATGVASEIGPLGRPSFTESLRALSFTDDRLLGPALEWNGFNYSFALFEIDRATGAASRLFGLPFLSNATIFPIVGMAPAVEAGQLWASVGHGLPSLPPSSQLSFHRFDANSGAELESQSAAGLDAPGLSSLAGIQPAPALIDVPALDSPGLLLLSLLLLVLAVRRLR